MATYTKQEALASLNHDIAQKRRESLRMAREAITKLQRFIADEERETSIDHFGGYATQVLMDGDITRDVTDAACRASMALGMLAARNELLAPTEDEEYGK